MDAWVATYVLTLRGCATLGGPRPGLAGYLIWSSGDSTCTLTRRCGGRISGRGHGRDHGHGPFDHDYEQDQGHRQGHGQSH